MHSSVGPVCAVTVRTADFGFGISFFTSVEVISICCSARSLTARGPVERNVPRRLHVPIRRQRGSEFRDESS